MLILRTVFLILTWLIVGEAMAALTALIVPASLGTKAGRFAWYWASVRVILWPLVLIFALFYALSIPVELIWKRVTQNGQIRRPA